MHTGRRLATTAGATVLTFVALGGVANADPLGDVTGGLTDTLGGVVDSVTGGAVRLSPSAESSAAESSDSESDRESTSRSSSTSTSTSRSTPTSTSRSSGAKPLLSVGLNGPVRAGAKVGAQSSPGNGTQANVSVNASAGNLLSASVNVGVDTCGFAPEVCGMVPPPDNPPAPPPPGTPPGTGTPPAPPPGVTGPSGAGPSAPGATASMPSSMQETLPFTGSPVGTLALIGLAAVLMGSAAVGGSRLRLRRDPE
jgi:hypothetical protein